MKDDYIFTRNVVVRWVFAFFLTINKSQSEINFTYINTWEKKMCIVE